VPSSVYIRCSNNNICTFCIFTQICVSKKHEHFSQLCKIGTKCFPELLTAYDKKIEKLRLTAFDKFVIMTGRHFFHLLHVCKERLLSVNFCCVLCYTNPSFMLGVIYTGKIVGMAWGS
jgi:hypothetical protein